MCPTCRWIQQHQRSRLPATLEEPQSEEVSAAEEGETWMTPLVRYLENDILPEDCNEARKIKKQAARSPETSDPGQPLQKVARPQWHVHKSKMGMRHKAGMGMRKPKYGVKTTYNPCTA
ncbi:hypothetical protein F2Q68_00016373 [Brassica cretica]|uniref:Uncharacterized protein n=1 Tax=Brassica cretica TaxID=69181 RepID=A0A8S9HMQ4_BRACR|nr:hypothetical protein F2Q68_00016373 [Brassica cretica]